MEFTKLEWEIIKHRLEVPWALAEALETLTEHSKDEIASRAETLRRIGPKFEDLDELNQLILKDCADGSTFFVALKWERIEGKIGHGKYMAYCRAANSLEDKLDADIPRN